MHYVIIACGIQLGRDYTRLHYPFANAYFLNIFTVVSMIYRHDTLRRESEFILELLNCKKTENFQFQIKRIRPLLKKVSKKLFHSSN